MPIYEYRCKACDKTFEVIQRVGEGPLRKCRECSGKLEKLISRSAFQLKGGGWYAEGYSGRGAAKKPDSSTKTTDSSASKPKVKPKAATGDSKD